jgi:hypothetical protein
MSRGPGTIQRAILDALATGDVLTVADLAHHAGIVHDDGTVTFAAYTSLTRAIRRLWRTVLRERDIAGRQPVYVLRSCWPSPLSADDACDRATAKVERWGALCARFHARPHATITVTGRPWEAVRAAFRARRASRGSRPADESILDAIHAIHAFGAKARGEA